MIVSGYDLHLYCDGKGCKSGDLGYRGEAEFTGDEHGYNARQRARRAGWRLNLRDWSALCPSCVRSGAEVVPP